MNITEIKSTPRVINNTHESLFRSFHILNAVLEMIKRGDSEETIFEIVEFLKQEHWTHINVGPISKTFIKPDTV